MVEKGLERESDDVIVGVKAEGLIVNAVMNCSYIQVSNIQVALYDDRLEITSPGGLLPGVTIEMR